MYLEEWKKSDIPWKEHAIWNPYCQYIRMVKGEEFIKEAKDYHCTETELSHINRVDPTNSWW